MPQAGVQLCIRTQRNQNHLSALFGEVARLGFAGVETGNLFRQIGDEVQVRRLFSETGLALCGCHTEISECLDPDKLAEDIRFVQSLGSRYLICSGVGERTLGVSEYREAGKLLNEVGKRCQETGIFLCYRHEVAEFDVREGSTSGMDLLDQLTDPKLVKYCLDIRGLHLAQIDPVQFINDHRERAIYFHFQDRSWGEKGPAEVTKLERGAADAKAAYLAAASLNPEWIVYQHDRSRYFPSQGLLASRNFSETVGSMSSSD